MEHHASGCSFMPLNSTSCLFPSLFWTFLPNHLSPTVSFSGKLFSCELTGWLTASFAARLWNVPGNTTCLVQTSAHKHGRGPADKTPMWPKAEKGVCREIITYLTLIQLFHNRESMWLTDFPAWKYKYLKVMMYVSPYKIETWWLLRWAQVARGLCLS